MLQNRIEYKLFTNLKIYKITAKVPDVLCCADISHLYYRLKGQREKPDNNVRVILIL
jgi:hypothetical protein